MSPPAPAPSRIVAAIELVGVLNKGEHAGAFSLRWLKSLGIIGTRARLFVRQF